MVHASLITRHGGLALGVFFLISLDAAFAFATCPIVVEPADTDAKWMTIAIAVEKRLTEHPDASQDCRSVTITVEQSTIRCLHGKIANPLPMP